jgi:hypothetical protein
VGFSLGARLIFSCLKELAKRGALGLVQNVYLFGSPIVAKKEEYLRARTVVSGRFLNAYASNDWILGYLFRATSGGIGRVSGLSSVDVPGIENKDVTDLVPGHMAYRGMMPILLQEVGWLVDSVEFTEIEDPDPEDHEKRQRELLNEIEAARHELEEKQTGTKASGFKSFFTRKKAVKKQWETYDERSQKALEGSEDPAEAEKIAQENNNVMFDVDAIRAEAMKLALQNPEDVEEIKQHLQVREIESTLPALRVDSSNVQESASSKDQIKQSKSLDETRTPSQQANGIANGQRRDDEVSMSFEADERPTLTISNNVSQHSLPPEAKSSQELASDRPPLKSAATTSDIPTSNFKAPEPPANPNHNPWTDEEEEFGRERNVQMSFE